MGATTQRAFLSGLDELAGEMILAGKSPSAVARLERQHAKQLCPPVRPSNDLLKARELASELKVSRTYVTYMRRAGYEFSHGRRTTYRSALAWLKANPRFRTQNFRKANGRRWLGVAEAVEGSTNPLNDNTNEKT